MALQVAPEHNNEQNICIMQVSLYHNVINAKATLPPFFSFIVAGTGLGSSILVDLCGLKSQ
jgi:hypothetical protein